MRASFFIAWVVLAATALLPWAGARQSGNGTKTASAPPAQETSRSRPWKITFDELVHNDATGEGEATMVVATSDQDTVIRADRFAWNDKTKIAHATGNLHMSDDRTEGTADRVDIEYQRDKRLMVLTGNVKLTLKPKKSGEATSADKENAGQGGASSKSTATDSQTVAGSGDTSDESAHLRDYPIEVTCDRVEYEYARDKRHAVLTGNFRAVQKLKDYTRTLLAERAEWFGREERVVLKGPVKLEDTKGRKGESPEDVEVFTREGKEGIRLKKGVYSMPVEENEGPSASPAERPTLPERKDSGRGSS